MKGRTVQFIKQSVFIKNVEAFTNGMGTNHSSHKHNTIQKSLDDIGYALLISTIEALILDNKYTLVRINDFSKRVCRSNEIQ